MKVPRLNCQANVYITSIELNVKLINLVIERTLTILINVIGLWMTEGYLQHLHTTHTRHTSHTRRKSIKC